MVAARQCVPLQPPLRPAAPFGRGSSTTGQRASLGSFSRLLPFASRMLWPSSASVSTACKKMVSLAYDAKVACDSLGSCIQKPPDTCDGLITFTHARIGLSLATTSSAAHIASTTASRGGHTSAPACARRSARERPLSAPPPPRLRHTLPVMSALSVWLYFTCRAGFSDTRRLLRAGAAAARSARRLRAASALSAFTALLAPPAPPAAARPSAAIARARSLSMSSSRRARFCATRRARSSSYALAISPPPALQRTPVPARARPRERNPTHAPARRAPAHRPGAPPTRCCGAGRRAADRVWRTSRSNAAGNGKRLLRRPMNARLRGVARGQHG